MKDKLRELAERWKSASNLAVSNCGYQLRQLLDAEGDGGAVGNEQSQVWVVQEKTLSQQMADAGYTRRPNPNPREEDDCGTSITDAFDADHPFTTAEPAQEQPGWKVPDGWRLVPIKATEKMRQEGAPHAGYEEEEAYSLDAVWAAMLSASPTPPKEN